MTAPFFSTPPPSTSTACGTLEVLVMTIVTLPDLADSDVLSNLSAPPGSAAIFRTLPPPEVAAAAAARGVRVGAA